MKKVILRSAGVILVATLAACDGGDPPVKETQSLLIAPFISGQYLCDEAVDNPAILDEEDAAMFCASKGKTGGARVSAALDTIGSKTSPSGKYQLGYTLHVPLMWYFKKVGTQWVLDTDILKANLSIISDVDRPVVVYLSENHFTDASLALRAELAQDPRNLMWTRSGPLDPDNYFNHPVIAWTLSDQSAPINVMRKQVFGAAVDAICNLPEASRKKIAAVSVLGEAHDLFPNFNDGPSFNVPSYNATDYSPVAVNGFRAWLTQKYGSITVLNHDLAASFASFAAINPPSKDIRTEQLSSFFDHIDAYAAGYIPIYGWLNDVKGRTLKVMVYLDGNQVGVAQTGLSRTDVTDAVPTIKDPNVGFRLNLDYRHIAYGIHTLEVLVSADGAAPVRLTRRNLVLVNRNQDTPPQIPYVDTNAQDISTHTSLSGNLDGPAPWASAFYNPMAQLWLEYRNQVVRNYVEQFGAMANSSCIAKDKIFSHQITPKLTGSWNGDLLAADASKLPSTQFNQGTTLYGGAAFGEAFLAMKKELGWDRYAVGEMHPVVKLDASQYLSMFDMHRTAGAAFVAPYYMSILPARLPSGSDLDRFRIAADNPRYGSDTYWQSIKDVMKQ
jgi:Beta-galactosidase